MVGKKQKKFDRCMKKWNGKWSIEVLVQLQWFGLITGVHCMRPMIRFTVNKWKATPWEVKGEELLLTLRYNLLYDRRKY